MEEIILNFIYNGKEINMPYNGNEYIKDILRRFAEEVNKNREDLYFLYNGQLIDENLILEKININNDNKLKILVFDDINKNKDDKKKIELSKDIICPRCGEICIIFIEDYKINLIECYNGHYIGNILFNEFNETQIIKEKLCYYCNKNRDETYQNQFYKCNKCNIYLCPLCKISHNKDFKEHIIIDYSPKKYLCKKHSENYISYCNECHKNQCESCSLIHDKNHFIYYFKDLIQIDNEENHLNEFDTKINFLKEQINDMKIILDKFMNNINIYYNIYKNVIKNHSKDYQLLINQKNLNKSSEIFLKDINDIIEADITKKFPIIFKMFEKMTIKNEIKIKYKINKNCDKIRIFGDRFVKNNKNNYLMFINESKYDLNSFINLKEIKLKDSIFELKLKEIKDSTNISYMFNECNSLFSLSGEKRWNTSNITNMSYLFYNCFSLLNLPDISKFITNNVNDMSFMFDNCCKLLNLPDISNWETKNVSKMNGMFHLCLCLAKLPDISKWNTSSVINMSMMFNGCSNLLTLPDISKWNTYNVTNMQMMFKKCSKLKSFPDLSKWNTSNVIDMSFMFDSCSNIDKLPDLSTWNTCNVTHINSVFQLCKSLSSLPDISNWNTNKIIDMSYIFFYCESLTSLPDISNWNTCNVKNMESIFEGCTILLSIPDISNWNTKKVTNMKAMFSKCSLLETLPDISKWNTNCVKDMSYMFEYCSSLLSLPDISKWNFSNVINISSMFYNCHQLKSKPDLSKCNLKNIFRKECPFNSIKQNNINNKDNNNSLMENPYIKKKENEDYSYELLDKENLEFYASYSSKYKEIQLKLKNNCELTWPEKETKLICDKESLIFFDDIILPSLKTGCNASIPIKLEIPYELPLDTYELEINFNVKGKNYSRPIILNIKIVNEIEAFRKEKNFI